METSVSGSDLAPSRSYARVGAAGWASRPASIIAAATVASCGSPDRVDTSVADSAGVAIVTNSGEPGLLDWTLDTTLVFGGDRVTVFDSTGVALALMGRQVMTADVGSRVLLVAPEGRIEGVLPEGWPMPLSFLPDGRPLVQVVDSLDFERIGIGRIVK